MPGVRAGALKVYKDELFIADTYNRCIRQIKTASPSENWQFAGRCEASYTPGVNTAKTAADDPNVRAPLSRCFLKAWLDSLLLAPGPTVVCGRSRCSSSLSAWLYHPAARSCMSETPMPARCTNCKCRLLVTQCNNGCHSSSSASSSSMSFLLSAPSSFSTLSSSSSASSSSSMSFLLSAPSSLLNFVEHSHAIIVTPGRCQLSHNYIDHD